MAEDIPMKMDGWDEAIIGVAMQAAMRAFVVYDYDMLIRAISKETESTWEAVEWADFNILSTFVGEGTPLILHTMPAKEVFDLIDDLSEKGAWARELAARARDPSKLVLEYEEVLRGRREAARILDLERKIVDLKRTVVELQEELTRMRGNR